MKYKNENINEQILSSQEVSRHNLKADCENCFGFCCVALYFSASEGFPEDKEAGIPCINLQSDFRCRVHNNLKERGLKGCIAYDCLGAGQKVAKVTYGGQDWRKVPESAKQMYDVFLIMKQIYEMLWYLTEALTLKPASEIHYEIKSMLDRTEKLTLLSPEELIKLDVTAHRVGVNAILLQASELVRNKFYNRQKNSPRGQKTLGRGLDLIGKDLRKMDMRGANLRGAYLIAANLRGVDLSGADLIGADLRDVDLRGANLTQSIFLTQAQVNTAKGDHSTRLPVSLTPPGHWLK